MGEEQGAPKRGSSVLGDPNTGVGGGGADTLRAMRILLTGATGLIGREVLRLAPADWEPVAVARTPIPGVTTVAADLTDPGFAAALPTDLDAIVHLAQARDYRHFPECAPGVVAVNVTAPAALLAHAARCGVGQVLLASTATVYEPLPRPLREDDPVRVRSIYATSKRSAELLAVPYAALLPVRALRIFTTYGAVRDGRLVADLIHRVETGHPVTVQGERGLMTSPIHASDVARAVIAAVQRPPAVGELDLVNVGGAPAGIRDMAEAIGGVLGREPVFEARAGEPPSFVADRTKALATLDLPAPLSFAEGVALDLVAG
jgi:nucleoside-diphosphate-sugar epimerase